MRKFLVRMQIGFEVQLPGDTVKHLDEVAGSGRDDDWGGELLGNLPPGTDVLSDCDIWDCEVEEIGGN